MKFISDGGAASLIFRNPDLDSAGNCYAVNIDKEDVSLDERDKLLIERMRINGRDSEISVEKAAKIMKCTEDTARKHLIRLV